MLSWADEMHPRHDELYADLADAELRRLPMGESLEMVNQRVAPYWHEQIVPHLQSLGPHKHMLITAH